jgi:NADH-quinone oxidoreductase subunit M
MTGEPSSEVRSTVHEITGRELAAVTPLIALIITLGFVPQLALNVINPAVDQVQIYLEVEDLPPAIGDVTSSGVVIGTEGVNS